MRNHTFGAADSYPVALLIKPTSFKKDDLIKHYVQPLEVRGLARDQIFAMTLEYNGEKKVKASFVKEYCADLLPELKSCGVKYMLVADAEYFKYLAKRPNAESCQGYVLPCAIAGYEDMFVVLTLNHSQLIYKPELREKLDASLDALVSHMHGRYQAPGTNIIHKAVYPETVDAIRACLEKLMSFPALTIDIEAFSLRFYEAGIGTIAFGTDQHRFVAFPVDYKENTPVIPLAEKRQDYGRFEPNHEVRSLLKWFFTNYKGKLIGHNLSYDAKVIIYTLWMKSLLDTENLLEGLEIMTRDMEDTKIVAYLATNTTAGNVLGLKPLAHEFAGNWAVEEIKDIKKIPLKELLQYNGVDVLSTFWVYNKYYPIMVNDQQTQVYRDLMLPSLKTLLQTELTGMSMSSTKIQETKTKLEALRDGYETVIRNSPVVQQMNLIVQTRAMEAANAKLKTKQHPLEKFADAVFNPGSGLQLQILLYELMSLPVLDYTESNQPATGADTLAKLIHHTDNPVYKELLSALIDYGKVNKILSTFIPAFEKAIKKDNSDIVWLHGNFNLGGTVSGRLSSNSPNLTNLPSGSTFGKVIKEEFCAPEGWLMVGADFSALESKVDTLLTRDPMKEVVYTDGFDSHCLASYFYFKDQMADITAELQGYFEGTQLVSKQDAVKIINSIKSRYPKLRQASKAVSFASLYGGTYLTLVANCGFTVEEAKAIEANYHDMYKVSDAWKLGKLQQASKDGYVSVAFGLRVRTPLLKQVIFGGYKMPTAAAAEGRTAGNALGQSYCMLNCRAANEFMEKVWNSKYRLDVKPIAQIHDASYYLIKRDLEVVEWVNKELIKSMGWQELPELAHPEIKLSAELDIFFPHWGHPITLPNDADQATIKKITDVAMTEYRKPKENK